MTEPEDLEAFLLLALLVAILFVVGQSADEAVHLHGNKLVLWKSRNSASNRASCKAAVSKILWFAPYKAGKGGDMNDDKMYTYTAITSCSYFEKGLSSTEVPI